MPTNLADYIYNISPDDAWKLAGELRRYLEPFKSNICVIPTIAGAGHCRQAYALSCFLRDYVGIDPMQIEMPPDEFFDNIYKWVQRRPRLYSRILKVLSRCPQHIVDSIVLKGAKPDLLMPKLKENPNYDPKRPTLFIPTNVSGEMATARLIRDGKVDPNSYVIAFPPDPWRGIQLCTMTSPITAPNHWVVTHDQKTMEEYKRLGRRGKAVPLGTLSPPYFLFNEPPVASGPLHIILEASGNYMPEVDELFILFLEGLLPYLRRREVMATVHCMHHRKTRERFEEFAAEQGLENNFRVIWNSDFWEAIKSRNDLITTGLGWPPPAASVTKGGEVPLEYRGKQLIACIFGGGHEGYDIEVGEEEGRAYDLRKVPPDLWAETTLEEVDKRRLNPPIIPISLAVFALLIALSEGEYQFDSVQH